jgi:hypothetical protein
LVYVLQLLFLIKLLLLLLLLLLLGFAGCKWVHSHLPRWHFNHSTLWFWCCRHAAEPDRQGSPHNK